MTRLSLSQFRTYASVSVSLEPAPVVLVGPNGIGKTNVLEAISYLGTGRGLRSATLQEPCRMPGDHAWAVAAQVMINGAPGPNIGIGLDPQSRSKRLVRINGANASGPLAISEYLTISWLTPAMDRLFLEGTTGRRRFLDRLVLALQPSHASTVSAYEKAMRQRNSLLSSDTPADPAWLTAIETQMAEHGVAIAAARRELIAQLQSATETQADSPFPKALIALDGTAETGLASLPAAAVEAQLLDTWRETRLRDRAAGRTLEGPHRTDLKVRHGTKDQAAEQCSTGEQKALLIGLVLAHAQMVHALTGRGPILLLDEVAAHLDSARRSALFQQLLQSPGQAWITGTDHAFFDGFNGGAQILTVRDGKIAHRPETE
ncbi:MAG: DNA replication/repair protein RecF [Pseudomonadota bacterium]